MTISLAYEDTVAPAVLVGVTGLPVVSAGTVTGIVQRSPDGGIRWTTVRGLAEAALDGSGDLVPVDDWEFVPDVVNTYRYGVNQDVVATFTSSVSSSWPAADTGQTWDAATSAFSSASGRGLQTHSASGTLGTTLSLTNIGDFTWEATLTVSPGTIVGGSLYHQMVVHRVDDDNQYQVTLEWQPDGDLILSLTAVNATVSTVLDGPVTLGFAHSGNATSVRCIVECDGNQVTVTVYDLSGPPPTEATIDLQIPTLYRIAAGGFRAASARHAANSNTTPAVRFDDMIIDTGTPTYLGSATITPTLTAIWLKSVTRPFLSRQVQIVSGPDVAVSRAGRGQLNQVPGRTYPIAGNDVRTAPTFTLQVKTATWEEAVMMGYLMASGDFLFLHVPSCAYHLVPTGGSVYVVAGDVSENWHPLRPLRRTWSLPCAQIAAPGPDVKAALSGWATVVSLYGGWPQIVAAGLSWPDLVALLGDPAEVIVP